MKSIIFIAAILALACMMTTVEGSGRYFDVCKSGPKQWVQECQTCNGRQGCLSCIRNVFSKYRNLHLAQECKTCIHTRNPGPCYKCIPAIPYSYDQQQRAQECKICANSKGHLVGGCNKCLAYAPTISHAYECKLCRSSTCFQCLSYTKDISKAYQCKNRH